MEVCVDLGWDQGRAIGQAPGFDGTGHMVSPAERPATKTAGIWLLVVVGTSRCTGPHAEPDGSIVDADSAVDVDLPSEVDLGVEPAAPAPPEPPQSPILLPCPPGWREVVDTETGLETCDPWPEGGPQSCPGVDEAHFPGEAGCVRVGVACSPESDWAVDLPEPSLFEGEILYVLAGAGEGGLGSREQPFGTIAEALELATPGVLVAIGKGTYDEALELQDEVTLHGACVAETLLTCTEPTEGSGTVTVRGQQVVLRNLRIGGGGAGLVLAEDVAAEARVEAVIVDEAEGAGIVVRSGGGLVAEDLVVRDTASSQTDQTGGYGLIARLGARVDLRRAAFEQNRVVSLLVSDPGTVLTLEDVVVRDTLSQQSDSLWGMGLNMSAGATATILRSAFERNKDAGVLAAEADTELILEDVVVRETSSREADGFFGDGIYLLLGAAGTITRTLVERNCGAGVTIRQMGAQAVLADVVV